MLPSVQPLSATYGIYDQSQAIDRTTLKTDGSVPTMATNAMMFSLRDGQLLHVLDMAKLMGHDLGKLNLTNTPETSMRRMLGNSLHIASAAVTMLGAVAAIGDVRLG